MFQRLLTSTLPTVAIAAALVAGTAHAQQDSTKSAAAYGGSARTERSVRKGNLFSAISFADSGFGAEWSRLLTDAQARYPGLKLTNREDLHVTVVFIGADWKPEDLGTLRALALVVPRAPVRLAPEVVRLGRNSQVVAVEMHAASTAWADSVVAAKAALNRLGLKKPEGYDTNFRTHITLAQAKHTPPTPADSTDLAGFQSWMGAKVAEDPGKFTLTLGPTTRVQLLLAGATRPEGAPEYIPVEDFLERQPAPPPGK
jgi:2'-5' RNA ligase